MADRDRKERQGHHASASHSSTSGGPLSFLPTIFGRRPAPAPAVTTRISTSTGDKQKSSGVNHDSIEGLGPTHDKKGGLGVPDSTPQRRSPSPVPFDLEEAIQVMSPKSGESTEVLCQMVKATAVYLANLLITQDDIFVDPNPKHESLPTDAQLQTLYGRAYNLASPSSDASLRIAALRLLAALFATRPPPRRQLDADPDHEHLTVPTFYRAIITPSSDNTTSLEQTFVTVGALKALTKNGSDVEGLNGLVGWLVKALSRTTDDYISYCAARDEYGFDFPESSKVQPFAPIKPATAGDVESAIVELLHAIISDHMPLFGSSDITRVVQPMLDLTWLGIAANPYPEQQMPIIPGSAIRRGSPASTALSSPSSNPSFGLGIGQIRSASLSRSRKTTFSSSTDTSPAATPTRQMPPPFNRATTVAATSPTATTSAILRSPSPDRSQTRSSSTPTPRWTRCFITLCHFLETLLNDTPIPDELFNRIMTLICLAFGQDDSDMMDIEAWTAADGVLQAALGPNGGRRGELAIRNTLEGKTVTISNNRSQKMSEEDRKIARGAVIAVQSLLHSPADGAAVGSDLTVSLSTLAPSIRAAASSLRFPEGKLFDRSRWQPVDYEILRLVRDHLQELFQGVGGEGSGLGDAWTEGQAVCAILKAMLPTVRNLKDDRGRVLGAKLLSLEGDEHHHLASLFASVVHMVPAAIGRLHSSTSTAPSFFHPRYIDLLLELSDNLDEADSTVILDYYQREGLCLPYTSAWILNIWRLLDAFYLAEHVIPGARRRVATFVLRDIYNYAEDLPQHRTELVVKVIVPFLEKVFSDDNDETFVHDALDVLVRAAVAETQEKDEYHISKSLDDDDASSPASPPAHLESRRTFDAIRALIITVATQTACKEEGVLASPVPEAASPHPGSTEVGSAEIKRRSSGRASSGLRSLMGSLSPPSRNAELPTFSSISHPMSPASSEGGSSQTPQTQNPTPPTTVPCSHNDCKSLHAVAALVSIFTRLAFAVPLSSSSDTGDRRVVTTRSIALFTDLLNLIYPMTSDTPGKPAPRLVLVPARCPRARLTGLQWFLRLRADNRHRLFVRPCPDKPATVFAEMLGRTQEKEQELRQAASEGDSRRSRHATAATRTEEDRGRSGRSAESGPRSRSRSKAPVVKGPSDGAYSPLWSIPTTMPFELPPSFQASEFLKTYDPNHPAVRDSDGSNEPIVDVWLPVSDYLRMINGVLRGHDWELVSFILSHLSLQLRNKTYFHGARATKEIRSLLDVLCDGVEDTRNPWDRRYNVPSFITRVKINSVAYQILAILISYHGIFTRDQLDRLLRTFILGLQGRRETAKISLQALTLCIYELETFVGRHLLTIVDRMKMILSTTAIAVHVLEFLISLGQNGGLFRNFTDEQYRLVFAVATSYISEHNARADTPSSDVEEYTLSQHVIGLAYYVIYIWFMALRLPQRRGHAKEVIRNILSARSQRVAVDEMAEVCFDWLGRYTYGNADPRPATSFLSDIVLADDRDGNPPKTQHWLLGGVIISITAHSRSGWCSIKATRPTGTTMMICKTENVPLLEVGEADADLTSMPAVLMANRGSSAPGEERSAREDESENEVKDIVDVRSSVKPEDMAAAQHGFVWSGATPSQRRKEVVIEPSYIGLQLLSSYPNASLETPRGRLIPQDDRFMRTIKGIDMTPVIDTLKIAVLYVGPGQTTETEILGNVDGSPLYLDFLTGLGRLIRLKGQVDVFVGGLDRADDNDGEYAYAWWDDLTQTVFHTATMMPNLENNPEMSNKKRLIGNDYVKIVYNDSGHEFVFDTIKTSFNMINIVIAPHTPGDWAFTDSEPAVPGTGENVDREDFFRVSLQRAEGIPDFSPFSEPKIISRRALPIMVRHMSHLANDLAARFAHIRDSADLSSAEYITSWRSRLRAMDRLRKSLPVHEVPDENDPIAREELLRDFTRNFSYQETANTD